jgi:hypothetical protein
MRTYLQAKHSWTDQVWDSINIPLFGRHLQTMPEATRRRHLKYIHDLQPLGHRLKRQNHQDDGHDKAGDNQLGRCPCCMQSIETQYHMIHCHKNEERENALDMLYLRPPNDKGIANTAKIFLDLVSQWMTNPIDTPSTQSLRQQENEIYLRSSCTDYTKALQRAIVEQTRIGWHNATRGYTGR